MSRRALVLSLSLLLVLAGLPTVPAAGGEQAPPGRNAAPATVPSLKQWHGGQGHWRITAASRIVVDRANAERLADTAEQFKADLRAFTGYRPRVVVGARERKGDLRLRVADLGTPERYRLAVGDVLAVEGDPAGVRHGTQAVLQALVGDPKRVRVPRGTATDWPDFAERGQMIDVGRKYFPPDYLKAQIRRMAWLRMNTLHLHLSDWNGFRFRSERFPGLASDEAYSKAELRDLQDYANRFGVTIIPEIDMPAHATHITTYDPRLAFSCRSLNQSFWPGREVTGWHLDITKDHTRQFVRDLLEEMLPLFDGPYFHIGGDEWHGDADKRACPELMEYAARKGYPEPGDVFVEFVNELNAQIRSHGKTTQLWQWWDYNGQRTTIKPDTNIVVNVWLGSPLEKAAEGYPVIGTDGNWLYVSPGFGTAPGQPGYMWAEAVYETYPFASAPGVQGYRISRWSDYVEHQPVAWFDFWSRRPLQVLAERTWGGPVSPTAGQFYQRVDALGEPPSRVTTIPADRYRLVRVDSEELIEENGAAVNALDNDPRTLWHSAYSAGEQAPPHELDVDLGDEYLLAGMRYLPRQDHGVNGRVGDYEVLTSLDGQDWTVAATGTFADDKTSKEVGFEPRPARYVRFRALDEVAGRPFTSAADLTFQQLATPSRGRGPTHER